ncbi:ABC transporter ATP-binding protein [Anaerovorax sp. IOR16]|uniref:ABC transporter ATP-binding protein n=1 Tax=Anaerovorax sp. IOR16 TaxID=2773458 RepID=UPI0019D127B4|nr:ABC transporter ATP-binding protein [Anaerovorax sp. IOR16]
MSEILKVENLEKYYGGKGIVTKAVDNISLSVEEGEYIGIMGASGSGKTTLLNCVSTIDSATAGHIYINGKNITKMKSKELAEFRRKELGFIFQDFNLLDTLTAYENIAIALTILKTPVNQIDKYIKEVANILNITDVLSKYPYQMSGGQKQRVASAGAIITNPTVVLADEPTGALNSSTTREVMDILNSINDEGTTVIIVTHDAKVAARANRVLFLMDGKIHDELTLGKFEGYDEMKSLREKRLSEWLEKQGF